MLTEAQNKLLTETNPGTQNNAVGDVVSLQPQDSGLPTGDSWHYSATGLPSGLSISPTSGLITGTITGSAHTYAASVTASDGEGASVSQSFTWNVSAAATTTTLVGSPVNPTYGQTETLTATVSSDAGTPNDGTVILEFPTAAAAKAWYDSPSYREVREHRLLGAIYRATLVEGV